MYSKTILKTICLTAFLAMGQQTWAQNDYFVTTDVPKADTVAVNTDETAEQTFLNKNFPYRSLCDWTQGMRFMVIPGEKDTYINVFIDNATEKEISTATLKHKILVYQGYSITDRGWIHFHFNVFGSDQRVYHEVRNFAFGEYCQKSAGGGIPTLAYLDEVDVAKKVLEGMTLYTKHETFYKDDSSSRNGSREYVLPIDTKLTVTKVGVGTREYPVKIILEDEKGNKCFQLCTLSHTNCGLNDNDIIAKNEQHLFDKAFSFSQRFKSDEDRRKSDPTKEFSALPRTGPTSPTNTRYVNYAGAVSGMVDKGQTREIVKLSKGAPDKTWKTKNGNIVWWYADGTEVTFSKKGISTRVRQTMGK